MPFTQPTFLFVFLPAMLALYFLAIALANIGAATADLKTANAVLVLASLLFYQQGAGRYIALFCASIAFNWWCAAAIDRAHARVAPPPLGRPKALLTCGVAANLLVLAAFAYANAVAGNAGTL